MKIYDLKISEKNNAVSVDFKGSLSLQNIQNIKEELMPHFLKNKKMSIKISEVESLDLSMIQMLYSLRKTALNEKKELTLSISLPEDLNILINKNGFTDLLTFNNSKK